jgi:hypothetical protein
MTARLSAAVTFLNGVSNDEKASILWAVASFCCFPSSSFAAPMAGALAGETIMSPHP